MQLGFDFDGVTAYTERLKQTIAKKLFDKDVTPAEMFIDSIHNGKSPITPAEYEQVLHELWMNEDWYVFLEPVPGAVETLRFFGEQGHDVKIVSGRDGRGIELAEKWIKAHGIDAPLYGVGYRKSKADAAKGCDVFVDDDSAYLKPLVDVVPNRYLFSWVYNEHQDIEGIATRVYGWDGVRDAIAALQK